MEVLGGNTTTAERVCVIGTALSHWSADVLFLERNVGRERCVSCCKNGADTLLLDFSLAKTVGLVASNWFVRLNQIKLMLFDNL